MNLNKLMKQAQKMQEQMAKTQAELEAENCRSERGRWESESDGKRRRRHHRDQDR